MRVAVPLAVPQDALKHVAEVAKRAEAAGMDGVSYGEMASDPMLHLTVASGVTSRVQLMTNIIVAFARSPMVLAVQARSLQDYSGGRLILGIGSQIKPHIERRFSMPWSSPAARMAEYIAAMRAIWYSWETGEKLNFRGDYYTHTLMTPMFTPRSDFPAPKIFLAAVGERMTETAGAAADGILIHPFSTARYIGFPASSRTWPLRLVEGHERLRRGEHRLCDHWAHRGRVCQLHSPGSGADSLLRLHTLLPASSGPSWVG